MAVASAQAQGGRAASSSPARWWRRGRSLGFLPGTLTEQGGPLPPAALRRALRHDRHGARRSSSSKATSSRSRRSPSCAGAPWTTAFIILDEAQNTTPEQMKMFLTRLGLRLEDGRHRRRDPDRPAARRVGAQRTCAASSKASTTSRFATSPAKTSSATRWWPRSWPLTTHSGQRRRDPHGHPDQLRLPQGRPRTDMPLEELTRFVLAREDKPFNTEVSVSFVTDEAIAQLNEKYRAQGRADRRALLRMRRGGRRPVGHDRWRKIRDVYELGDVVIAPDVADPPDARVRHHVRGGDQPASGPRPSAPVRLRPHRGRRSRGHGEARGRDPGGVGEARREGRKGIRPRLGRGAAPAAMCPSQPACIGHAGRGKGT